MQNPFTTTFSKIPEYTYIATEKTDEVLENFSYEYPSESVYKITGVRGSGKTVILAKIEEYLRNDENMQKVWIVCDINPNRDMLEQMAAILYKEGLGNNKIKSVNVSASILGTGGGFGYSGENPYFDIGIETEEMIKKAQDQQRKILVGIDEVSKTKGMIEFASEYGRWLRAGYPVYMVCTGLYENIQEVSNVKNLTFFRRATTVKTEPLNMVRMTEMYRNQLDISLDEAKAMANYTKGYAFAFQELGVLYCKKRPGETLDDVLPLYKSELFAYSYEKIWEEMTEGDRFFVKQIIDKEEYKREEVLVSMGARKNNYSVYRDRLLKRGIIASRKAYIYLALPFFAEYIRDYC